MRFVFDILVIYIRLESAGPEYADVGVAAQIGSGFLRFFAVFFGSAGNCLL